MVAVPRCRLLLCNLPVLCVMKSNYPFWKSSLKKIKIQNIYIFFFVYFFIRSINGLYEISYTTLVL